MKIFFKTVRLKYYKIAVYFLGVSFLFISGCRSKNVENNTSVNSESTETKSIINSAKDTSKNQPNITLQKPILEEKIPVKKKKPAYKPDSNRVMKPVTAYGVNTYDYKVTVPTENKNSNEK